MFSDVDITSLLIFFFIFLLMYVWFRKPAGLPPGPMFTLPVLGDLPQLATAKGDVFGALRKLRKKHGRIYSFYMGRQLAIIVNGYDMIHKVAVERGMQYCGRPKDYITDIISKGRGLAFSTGNKWKQQRLFADRAFRKLGMKRKSYERQIIRKVKAFVEVLDKQRCQPFDIKTSIHASAANVLFTSIIGKHYENDDPLFQGFLQLAANQTKLLPRTSILLNCLPFLKYLPGDPLQMLSLQKQFQTFEKFVKEHVVEPILKNPPKEATTFVEMYIDKIKEQENKDVEPVFTFDEMNVVLLDILVAGSETVPTTIRWAILYLINFPDIQKRLQQEIDEAIPPEKTPCLDDKVKLPYIEAFIAEVLRCADIAPLGVARADVDGNDSYLEGCLIPKNAAILFDFDSIFMNPNIFEQPEIFNPDRYLDEAGMFVKPKELVPFSLGRRVCLGDQLGDWELFLYMANLIKTFAFLPADEEKLPKIHGHLDFSHAPDMYSVRCLRRDNIDI